MGCTILIETLLNPLLHDPCPPVVKLDAIQIIPIEASSGTHITCPVISCLASKQQKLYGQWKRKRTNEQGVVQNVEVADVPPSRFLEDGLMVQNVLNATPIGNLPKLNQWKLNRDLSTNK